MKVYNTKQDFRHLNQSNWIGRYQYKQFHKSTDFSAKFMTGLFLIMAVGLVLVLLTK